MKRAKSIVVAILFACTAFLQFACNNNNRPAPPTAFFEHLLDSVGNASTPTPKAVAFLDSVFAAYPNASAQARYSYYGFNCGYYHTFANDEKKALLYADSMLMVTHANPGLKDYDKKDAISNISKGDALFGLKEYNEAYQYYYLGKLAAEKSLDPCTYSEYSYRLGMVLYKKASYADAAVYFKKSFGESSSCADSFGEFYRRQELLNNTALSYKKSGQPDSAVAYYNKALDFITARENAEKGGKGAYELARGVVYGNMGQIYAATDFAKAEELYKKSIAINGRPGYDLNDALVTQQHLADLYYSKNDYGAMYGVLQQIKRGLDTIKNAGIKTGFSQLMWKYYDMHKDVPNAYAYLQQYNNLKDSEIANNKKLSESDVTGQMKNLEAAYQMNLLKKDSKLQQVYFFVAVALFISAGIISLLVFNNFKKGKKHIKTLTALNDKINKQKEQLENMLGELGERGKEKDRILGIVAHDLRNPISAISGLITLMEYGHEYSEDQTQVLELMQNACSNSLELINEILEFAINDGSGSDAKPEPVDVNLIARNCVKMLSFKAAEKKQKLQLDLSGSAEIVKANPAKMWRVLSNLITNAVKFSPSGAVIRIVTEHRDGKVQVSVHDKGIGIPDNLKNKIFDTHTEAKRPGTQGEKPFGLGLSICKQIVETYKGKIWFETTVGQGTIFYISLPKEHDLVQA